MALYKIEKSKPNTDTRWAGKQWWVDAGNEQEAIALGRKNWPSKNTVDQYHATLLTEEEIDAYYAEQAEIEIRLAAKGGGSVFDRQRADRMAAYYVKCGENKKRALSQNVERLHGALPVIEKIAEKIDEDTQKKIDDLYR